MFLMSSDRLLAGSRWVSIASGTRLHPRIRDRLPYNAWILWLTGLQAWRDPVGKLILGQRLYAEIQ
jgi:hypothetical protein